MSRAGDGRAAEDGASTLEIANVASALEKENEVPAERMFACTQDECVEWDEGLQMDLRQMLESPYPTPSVRRPNAKRSVNLLDIHQNLIASKATSPKVTRKHSKGAVVEKEVDEVLHTIAKEGERPRVDVRNDRDSELLKEGSRQHETQQHGKKRRGTSKQRKPKRRHSADHTSSLVDTSDRVKRRIRTKKASAICGTVQKTLSEKVYADLDGLLHDLQTDTETHTSQDTETSNSKTNVPRRPTQAQAKARSPTIVERCIPETHNATETMEQAGTQSGADLFTGNDEEFANLLDFSEADLEKMDTLGGNAEKSRGRNDFASNALSHPQTHVGRTGQSLRNQTVVTSFSDVNGKENKVSGESAPIEDPFGDFPEIDFAALDQQIADRSVAVSSASRSLDSTVSTSPPMSTPVQNRMAPVADPCISFLTFTRYKVVGVTEDAGNFNKTLLVVTWNSSMTDTENEHSGGIRDPEQQESAGSSVVAEGLIFLRGEWFHTRVNVGDIVHLCSIGGRYKTDSGSLPVLLHTDPPPGSDLDDDLVLIVHPDMLITPTAVSEAVSCPRRAVIRSRLGSSGKMARAALIGTMRHALFERCMGTQNFTAHAARVFSRSIVRNSADSLVGCGMKDGEAEAEIIKILPQLQQFAREFTTFYGSKVNQESLEGASDSMLQKHGARSNVIKHLAQTVEATEESVVSPELGLKGFVDMTVSAAAVTPANALMDTTSSRPQTHDPLTSLMSVELKTGHNQTPHPTHMAQLALYSLMLRVRYGSNPHTKVTTQGVSARRDGELAGANGGILLYLNDKSYQDMYVSPTLNEIRSLIGQRNAVASELRRSTQPGGIVVSYEKDNDTNDTTRKRIYLEVAPPTALPTIESSYNQCERCYANRECMVYARAEHSTCFSLQKTHGHILSHFTGSLNEDDMAYFRKWNRLIDLESSANAVNPTEAWLVGSSDRETSTGKCMSDLIFEELGTMSINSVVPGSSPGNLAGLANATALIQFSRSHDSALKTHLSRLAIEPGSHVIVSTDSTSISDSFRAGVDKGQRRVRRHFRHRMHVVRGIVDRVFETSIYIRSSMGELQQIQKLAVRFNQQTLEDSTTGMTRKNRIITGVQPLRFRIDKDEVATGTGTLRQNLINLLSDDAEPFSASDKERVPALSENRLLRPSARLRVNFLREAIVRLRPPTFQTSTKDALFEGIQTGLAIELKSDFDQLNPDQKHAIEKVIGANDYALIQGLPGTGKSHVITFVARLLVARGKRVLISSYTHSAVDNIMTKLMQQRLAATTASTPFPTVVRLGRKSSCHPSVHPILAESIASVLDERNQASVSTQQVDNVEDSPSANSLRLVLDSANVVGVSALTVPRTSLLNGQHFDVVIVDEAGQISQPAILGALLAADSFILVGDHMQLPPLVKSEVAEEGGFGVSLLKRLAENFPASVAQLTMQYRMNNDICRICNDIVYNGKLKCANEEVSTRRLNLPGFPSALPPSINGRLDPQGWLMGIIDPDMPVIFANTDMIQQTARSSQQEDVAFSGASRNGEDSTTSTFIPLETTSGRSSIVNLFEVEILRYIVHGLTICGLEESAIGVISPFRAQLRQLDSSESFRRWKEAGLEASTIDRYQGRDKQVIILSFVRSNSKGKAGKLLEDFRRLNVAVSRAKMKLILVGSFKTLHTGSSVLRPVLDGFQKRNLVQTLPENALDMYRHLF